MKKANASTSEKRSASDTASNPFHPHQLLNTIDRRIDRALEFVDRWIDPVLEAIFSRMEKAFDFVFRQTPPPYSKVDNSSTSSPSDSASSKHSKAAILTFDQQMETVVGEQATFAPAAGPRVTFIVTKSSVITK